MLERPGEYALIVTFAISLIVGSSMLVIFGGFYHRPPGFWPDTVSIGDWIRVSGDRVVGFGAAIALIAALLWVIRSTDTGRAWRALAQSRLGAQVVGVDVRALSNRAFAASGALAGASAALVAPILSVYPAGGDSALIKSFIAVIIGGLGSVPGSLIGGLMLGLVEATRRRIHQLGIHRRVRLSNHGVRVAPAAGRAVRTQGEAGVMSGPRRQGVSKSFGGNQVLRSVSLVVEPGELVALVGPNGAGKTTLLNVISGQFRPDEGRVGFNGGDVTGLPPANRKRHAMVRSYQDGGVFGDLTAVENVMVTLVARGVRRSAARAAAREVVHRLGLGRVVDEPAKRLSGGQRKLVDFGRLLVVDAVCNCSTSRPPEYFPPCATRWPALSASAGTPGVASLIISHDLPWALAVCSRVIVLARGDGPGERHPGRRAGRRSVREAYLA